ncbi:hypothetical protein DYB26_001914 [Aphanomyces astaci]|uniref:Uncharacterized protein n=1 Tax=Aphanomyces astaci TaxID=112090 RepID=A0A397EN27_APHAT|nr:hypothetical protein DYB31_002835 [Aphanomyces astaci]RHZ18269.1 hypothetical protein DYB26_001914 [Aphanomyces astaci]
MFSFVTAQYQWYKLEFGLTLLSPWEVFTFSTCPSPRSPIFGLTDGVVVDAIVVFVLSATAYFSVCVVGNGNVGKTSLTTRYAKGRFTDNYKKTIGVDFMERVVTVDGEDIHLMIWDTAGQEEFDSLTSRYYRGAGAVVYVFSTVDRDSFDALPSWQQKVKHECGPSICQVLVQNKIDLVEDAVMTKDEVDDMKEDMRVRLYRTSVQDNQNVEEVFEYLCRRYLKKKAPEEAAVSDIGGGAASPTKKAKPKDKSSRHQSKSERGDGEAPTTPKSKVSTKAKSNRFKGGDDHHGLSFDDIRLALPPNGEGDHVQRIDDDLQNDDQTDSQRPPKISNPHEDEEASSSMPPHSSDIPDDVGGSGAALEPSKRRTNGKKKDAFFNIMFTYNHITGAKLCYMHVPVEVDAFSVREKLQQEHREAKEERQMAWEDYFAAQWGKAEREATTKTQQRLQHQIEQLSTITVTSRNFELWNTAIERKYYEYVSYSLLDLAIRDTLLTNVHYGLTPLARACTIKDYRLVRILLAHGADSTAKTPSSPYGYMQSVFRASVADVRVFELLVQSLPPSPELELRGLDDDGLSLMHLAAQGGFVDVLERLLALPMTHDLVDTTTPKNRYTALHYAVAGGHVACVVLLLRHMAPSVAAAMTSDGRNALHLALRVEGSHFHLEQLVESFVSANLFEAIDPNGATALHLAVGQNLERIALRLINLGKTPMNVCTKGGVAALHLAVMVENMMLVRALQHHNAMIDIMDDNGQTPLLTAALLNHTECIRLLLDCGADAGCQNKEGHAPLHYLASYCTDPDTFQLFFTKDYFKLVVKDLAEVTPPSSDHNDQAIDDNSGGSHHRKTKALGTREPLKNKKAGVTLPKVRPVTAVDPTSTSEYDTDAESDPCRHPWTAKSPTRHVCMTPYVKRQLFGRVRAPNKPADLTDEMDELFLYNQPPKPAPEHPQAKHMVFFVRASNLRDIMGLLAATV